MDCGHELWCGEDNCSCTMDYESVIGRGHIEMVPDEEKLAALRILMEHYREGDFPFNPAVVAKTRVFKLVVEQMTGKIHDKKRRSHAEQRKQNEISAARGNFPGGIFTPSLPPDLHAP